MKPSPSTWRSHQTLYVIQWVLVFVLFAGLVAICAYALRYFDQPPLNPIVAFDEIEYTQEPPHVKERTPYQDFLHEVKSPTALGDKLDTTDPALKMMLAEAFRLHPWVESVEEVSVVPGRNIRVSLVYRTPVAVVRIGRDRYTVDALGRRLPDVSDSYKLLVIEGIADKPTGAVTQEYGSPLVAAASRLAGLLAPYRAGWKLRSIEYVKDPVKPDKQEFHVLAESGFWINWGGIVEARDVESWEHRLERLRAHAKQYRSLEDGVSHLDISDPKEIKRFPKLK